MKIRKIFLGIIVGLLVLTVFGIYKLETFTIFDEEFKVIKNIAPPNKGYIIKIYLIPSNASSQSYIQIRKFENNIEEVIENYEQYDNLDGYYIKNDTLVLKINNSILSRSEVKKCLLP